MENNCGRCSDGPVKMACCRSRLTTCGCCWAAMPNTIMMMNLTQTLQRLRKNMQTVSIHEPSDSHFDIPDMFKKFLRYDSGKDDHKRIFLVIPIYGFSKFLSFDGLRTERSNYLLKTSNKFTSFMCIFRYCSCLSVCHSSKQNGKKRIPDYLMPYKPWP